MNIAHSRPGHYIESTDQFFVTHYKLCCRYQLYCQCRYVVSLTSIVFHYQFKFLLLPFIKSLSVILSPTVSYIIVMNYQ